MTRICNPYGPTITSPWDRGPRDPRGVPRDQNFRSKIFLILSSNDVILWVLLIGYSKNAENWQKHVFLGTFGHKIAKTGKMTYFCQFSAFFDQQTSETHKISSLEDGMRKFLRPKFWSHGTHLGSLWPLSWKEGPLGFPQTQFRVTLDPYDLPVLVAWLGDPENPKLFRAWCDTTIL